MAFCLLETINIQYPLFYFDNWSFHFNTKTTITYLGKEGHASICMLHKSIAFCVLSISLLGSDSKHCISVNKNSLGKVVIQNAGSLIIPINILTDFVFVWENVVVVF